MIKILLAHAAQHFLLVYQYDFKTAFLNSLIGDDEEIYVEQPHGFEVTEVNGKKGKYVCKLKKGLYGLKQSPRLWAGTLTAWLLSYGFVAASSTDCLFILHAGAAYIYLAYWVDDMLLVSNCDDTRKKFEKAIMDPKTGFKVTCEGTASWFLGFQIKQHVTPDGKPIGRIEISQPSYIKQMAEKFHPECMKPSGKNPVPSTPLDPNVNLAEQMAKGPTDKEKDAEETAKWDVKAIVGTLIYLMITTRFDLMFAVGQAARYVARPSMILVKALKRIIAYAYWTSGLTMCFKHTTNALDVEKVRAWVDAAYIDCPESLRSTGGHIVTVNGCPVSCESKRQPLVTLSTAEAEYVQACRCTTEVMYVREICADLGYDMSEPSVIFEDNKACISISTGDTDKKRTKHIAKHWHFVREKCAAGLVVLKYLETALQVADMFTKQIFPKHFERLRRVMMGHENFDDMQARYVQVKASGDDMDDPKLYVDSKPGRPPK